jgi:uncharacterized protein YgbK (DUF1537 family)
MSLVLGSVADDYTGASDLANTLASNGLRVVQTIGPPPDDLELPDVDGVVVALKSRSIAAEDAVALSLTAEAWLRERGARHVLFKVCSTFDSTPAGNIGPVTDALLARAGGVALVCPAFPQTRRTIYQGHLFVGTQPLDESPLKDHPLNPMRDSSLVRLMAQQSRASVGLIPLDIVEQGVEAVRGEVARLAAVGFGSIVIDAVFDHHLETIGRVALDLAISVGASGLGLGLARALSPRQPARASANDNRERGQAGKVLILAGSCSAATLQQIAIAKAEIPVYHLDIEGLIDGEDATGRAIAFASRHLDQGPVLIASSRPPEAVAAVQNRYGAAVVSHAIEAALADIAEALLPSGVSKLIVAGGESSGAVVDRLGFQAFRLGQEIAPGVPLLHAIGAHHPGLRIALKSGNFGGPDFFARAIAAC